jgi:hypothetical protein
MARSSCRWFDRRVSGDLNASTVVASAVPSRFRPGCAGDSARHTNTLYSPHLSFLVADCERTTILWSERKVSATRAFRESCRMQRPDSNFPPTKNLLKWLAGACGVAYTILFSALWDIWNWADWITFSIGVAAVLWLFVAARSAFRSKALVSSDTPTARKYPPSMTTTFFISGLWLFSFVSCVARPTPTTVLAPLPLTLVFLVICVQDFGRVFIQWKPYRYRALIPFTTCILVGVLGWEVKGPLNRALFWHWRLPGYEATIQKIESRTIPVSGEERRLLPNEYDGRLALNAWAERDDKGSLIVTFLYGNTGAVGLKDAFVYCGSGQLSTNDDKIWRWKTRLNDKWFRVEL